MDKIAAVGLPETASQKDFSPFERSEFAWSVLDGLPTATVVCEHTTAGLRVVYHNPRFRELMQLAEAAINGTNLVVLLEAGLDGRGLATLMAPTDCVDVGFETAAGCNATLRLTAHPTETNYWIASFTTQAALVPATKLHEIVTSIPGAIFQWEIAPTHNHLNFVSEGIAALTQLDYAAVIEDPSKVLDLVDADSRRALVRRALLACDQLENFHMEVPISLPGLQNRRWVKLSVSARQADNGSVLLDGLIDDVTNVKQHGQALLAARNQLDGLTRSIPGMVYQAVYIDGDLVPASLFVSRGAEDVFGVSSRQILHDPTLMNRMVLVEDLPALQASLRQAISEFTLWNHEFRIRDAAGRLKWIHARAAPMEANADGGVQFNGVLLDATDRQRTVRRLRDAEEQLRDITASMPGFVFRMDVFRHGHTRLSYVSEGVREIYAMTAAEVLGASSHELAQMVVAEDRGLMDEAVGEALQTGNTVTLERRLVDALGNEHWLQSLLRPQPSLDGPVSLVGLTLDVTERKQAEEALRASEERYRAVVQDQSEIVCRLDSEGRVTFINEAGARCLGPLAHCLGTLWWQLLPRASRDIAEQKLRSLTASSPAEGIEVRTNSGDAESVWHQWRLRAFVGTGGELTGFQAVGRDVTELKGLERQVRSIADREQQRIGHDLHDGLGQELTGLSLLLKSLEHGVVSHAPDLLAYVKNAQGVLNDSIATTRALAQGLSPVHLERDGLAGALEQLAANFESLHHVPIVVSHRGRRSVEVSIVTEFYRIAQEAVNNAVRHARATKIHVDLDLQRGMRLVVSDDGCGIKHDTTDGMGLRIMQYRADLLGAQLVVRNDANGGTMVICELTEQGLVGGE